MFEVDLKGRKSIYEQVVDNIKEHILLGVIPAEEKLPSVRELSKCLTVNPNTVQKAFKELERQGYIYTVQGIGSFASSKESIELDEKLIAETKSKLMDDMKELFYLFPDEESVDNIIEEIRKEAKELLLPAKKTKKKDVKNA